MIQAPVWIARPSKKFFPTQPSAKPFTSFSIGSWKERCRSGACAFIWSCSASGHNFCPANGHPRVGADAFTASRANGPACCSRTLLERWATKFNFGVNGFARTPLRLHPHPLRQIGITSRAQLLESFDLLARCIEPDRNTRGLRLDAGG
jgi:hypothetical protein